MIFRFDKKTETQKIAHILKIIVELDVLFANTAQ